MAAPSSTTTGCPRIRLQSVLLVIGTALVTWFISTWLSFVHYSHLHDALLGLGGGSSASRDGGGANDCPSAMWSFYGSGTGGSSSSSSSNLRQLPSRDSSASSPSTTTTTTTKRKIWANLSLIDDPHSNVIIPSKVYEPFQHPFPCFPGEKGLQLVKPAHEGILFQRPQKTGTTTTVGIVMRLAHNRFENLSQIQKSYFMPDAPKCLHRSNHGSGVELEYRKRNKTRSFLFSLIRDPTARSISEFFHFDVTVGQKEPTDPIFMHTVKLPHYSTYYLRTLTVDPTLRVQKVHKAPNATHDAVISFPHEGKYADVVQSILDSYDLIMISERLDESLIVLKLLLGLTYDEIMYLQPARSAGSFSNGPPESRPCIYLIPSFVTPTVQNFLLHDPVWRQHIEGDELLYLSAVKSLDRTIDQLGRSKVQSQLGVFRKLQSYAQSQCSGPTDVLGMCDSGGNFIPPAQRTCYIWGEGCDHKCLNKIASSYPPHLQELIAKHE